MGHVHDTHIKRLEEIANDIREDIVRMLVVAGSGHAGGSLGMADVFTALYFHILKHNPKRPMWEERDRLLLSNGHICPVRYAAMAHAGYFPRQELLMLRKFGSRLQGHPERTRLPALESTSGPLGEGLAQAAGLAYAARMDKKTWRTYCVTGDGELDEGIIWESLLFAGNKKLSNLTVIIDRNNIQIDGRTEDVADLEPLRAKLEAFNFHVLEINGNDIRAIIDACEIAKTVTEKPTAIIAYTVPGKGVDYMEYDFAWHGKTPKPGPEERSALQQLEALGKSLKRDHA